MYFGNIEQIQKQLFVKDVIPNDPSTTDNNIFNPNSAILMFAKMSEENESNILTQIENGNNNLHGNHFIRISPTSDQGILEANSGIVSSNLFPNKFSDSDGHSPNFDINKIFKDTFVPHSAKFYLRNNPDTGLMEQRLIFTQSTVHGEGDKKKILSVEISIIQSFDNDDSSNKIHTSIEYMNNSDDTIPELIGGISFISNKSNDFEINKKTSDINRENIDSNILSRNHQIPKQLYVKQNIFLVGSNDFQKTDITEREITVEEGQMAKLSNKLISNNDLSNNTIFNIENDFDEDSTNNDISNTTENIDQTKNEHHMLEISRGEKVIHKEKRIIKYTSSLQSPSVKSITKLRQEKNFTSDPTIAPQIILDDEFAKFDKDKSTDNQRRSNSGHV
jgi:hypothetical protein